jgi:hypothetical protein
MRKPVDLEVPAEERDPLAHADEAVPAVLAVAVVPPDHAAPVV